MYKSVNQEIELENYNKIYIPQDYVNQNYKYTISNDNITIITNQSCETNYNTTNCLCYTYNMKYNIITQNQNKCNYNPTNNVVSYNQISSNIDYSDRIVNYYYKEYGIYFFMVIIILLFISTMKRNSRNI